jgi:hypothetical protein
MDMLNKDAKGMLRIEIWIQLDQVTNQNDCIANLNNL